MNPSSQHRIAAEIFPSRPQATPTRPSLTRAALGSTFLQTTAESLSKLKLALSRRLRRHFRPLCTRPVPASPASRSTSPAPRARFADCSHRSAQFPHSICRRLAPLPPYLTVASTAPCSALPAPALPESRSALPVPWARLTGARRHIAVSCTLCAACRRILSSGATPAPPRVRRRLSRAQKLWTILAELFT